MNIESEIPEQEEGASSETNASHECNNDAEAKSFYNKVKKRLLNVNEWESIAGIASADFRLCNAAGDEVNREAEKGDHFKIDIPGPGPETGDGYDWVQVEDIIQKEDDECERIILTVRPATNPKNNNPDIAHFFNEAATSSFIAERCGHIVSAYVLGRNEIPNTEALKPLDKARNTAVAAAAITAFSKIQWKSLVNGLVAGG